MSGEWMGIESAPKDGTLVDLWVVEKYVLQTDRDKGERVANAFYGKELKYLYNSQETFDGWAYTDNQYTEQVERPLGGGERYATHWMPLPSPPKPLSNTD